MQQKEPDGASVELTLNEIVMEKIAIKILVYGDTCDVLCKNMTNRLHR